MASNKTIKTLRLNSDAVKRIEEMAKSNNRTFNNMVETIMLKFEPKHYTGLF
ncbi:hypothetical protein [Allomuricauda sp. d1]|uniref:hypothetical protein n=1 Tax=Allomuricauda sp. d1 TaxID=3136725 RepID=UPI0031D99C01